jgi:hypothetical protein
MYILVKIYFKIIKYEKLINSLSSLVLTNLHLKIYLYSIYFTLHYLIYNTSKCEV